VSGALRIFLYNWPLYAATWASAAVAVGVGTVLGGPLGAMVVVGALGAIAWSATSLAVSFHVYDRSPLARGTWITEFLPRGAPAWISVDTGLDAEVDLDAALAGPCLGRLDVYDGRIVGRGSVRRARSTTPRKHAAQPCSALALPLGDAACELACVVFTAHEVQLPADRVRFFEELRRVLAPGGRVLVVEHLRDVPNFLAFGPGFLHFLPRREWLRVAKATSFAVARTTTITPWVTALLLEKAP
jgi:SAM-dependent methyltransferase